MKPLTLTEEHKIKLLEMCKSLFPEYNNDIELDIDPTYDGHDMHVYLGLHVGYIHWFEFCTLHLTDKLGWCPSVLFQNSDGTVREEHPIDFMYDIYKQTH